MKKLLIGFALLGASSSVFAESLVYGGLSYGTTSYDGESGDAYSFHVGTSLAPLPLTSIEAGIYQFKNIDLPGGVEREGRSEYIALKPSITLGPIQAYAKGGVHRYDEDANGRKIDDGVDVMYGVGFDYYIAGPIAIGASYQIFKYDNEEMKTVTLNISAHIL